MPGKSYRGQHLPQQASEFDYYLRPGAPKPETAKEGERLLELGTRRTEVFIDGEWYGEPDASQDILGKLEEIRDEISGHLTIAADALLDKL